MKMFAPLGFVRGRRTRAAMSPTRRRRGGRDEDASRRSVAAGAAGDLRRARSWQLEELFPGLEEVMIGQPVGTPRAILLEQMELMGTEVLPPFREKQAKRSTTAVR